jgi:hypothetical protein
MFADGGVSMSFVLAAPELVATAASDLANLGSTIRTAHSAAAASTTGLAGMAADEVSVTITALFDVYTREYQALSGQAAAFHDYFVQQALPIRTPTP